MIAFPNKHNYLNDDKNFKKSKALEKNSQYDI
jgi:hypothetical protein